MGKFLKGHIIVVLLPFLLFCLTALTPVLSRLIAAKHTLFSNKSARFFHRVAAQATQYQLLIFQWSV